MSPTCCMSHTAVCAHGRLCTTLHISCSSWVNYVVHQRSRGCVSWSWRSLTASTLSRYELHVDGRKQLQVRAVRDRDNGRWRRRRWTTRRRQRHNGIAPVHSWRAAGVRRSNSRTTYLHRSSWQRLRCQHRQKVLRTWYVTIQRICNILYRKKFIHCGAKKRHHFVSAITLSNLSLFEWVLVHIYPNKCVTK